METLGWVLGWLVVAIGLANIILWGIAISKMANTERIYDRSHALPRKVPRR